MYEIGTKVREISNPERIGTIDSVTNCEGMVTYAVRFPDRIKYLSETSILIFQENQLVISNMLNDLYGEFNDFQKTLTYYKLINSNKIQNNIYAINSSRTKFLEYQYKPLMKFISSSKRRVMICDEVGLGKTIEAGLIIKELDARKELNRVLIVVPANLIRKWVDELFFRFGEIFTVVNAKEFKQLIDDNPLVRQKYKKERFIVSIESLRSKSMCENLDETDFQWDLLIVDEAHSLRNSSQQHIAIKKLSAACDAIVFLTATPIHTERKNLFNIMNILDEQQFPFYDSFENQLQINEPVIKALNLISQIPPKVDKALDILKPVESFYCNNAIYKDVITELGTFQNIHENSEQEELERIVEIQRSLSDLHFLGNTYTRTRKRDVTIGRAERKPQTRVIHFSDEEKNFYDALITAVRQQLTHTFPNSIFTLFNIQRMLSSSIHAHGTRLIDKYLQNVGSFEDIDLEENNSDLSTFTDHLPMADSKFDDLLCLLHEIRKHTLKVILFAFYIPTLKYLDKKLRESGFTTYLMHGQIKIDRTNLILSFKENKGFSILLSSRVGSEGIDLQFCNTMINYDLPWNPMEIEQRIGRIDRIGQESQFLNIYNFSMGNTIDDEIVLRLYDRIALFESSIGLLEPIMGELIDGIAKRVFFTNMSDEEKRKQFQQEELNIIQKTKDIQQLEEKSAEILSLDYFYEHEIKDIKGKSRYISPQQLYKYLVGYISVKYPDSMINYDFQNDMGEIFLCGSFMKDALSRDVDVGLPFKYGFTKPVKFTMDSDMAFKYSNLIFVNVMHPLVTYITSRYSEDEGCLLNTQYFCVQSEHLKEMSINLERGFYFYFQNLGTIKGLRERSYLIPVILNENLEPIGPRAYTEHVMAALIEKGKPAIHRFVCDDKPYIEQAYKTAKEIFQTWFISLYKKHVSKHDLIISRKEESIQFNYNRKILYQSNELDRIMAIGLELDEKKRFRVEMIEGKIKKLKHNLKIQMLKIQADRNISYEFEEPVLGGVFEVS